ncbi:hypothetical protein Tco_0189091 [Tanacetum coccineum]
MACLKLFAVISGINYRILVPLLGLRAVAAQVRISAIVTMGGYQFLKIGYSTERLTTGASLEAISAIENALGKVRDCQHGLYTAGGGNSRVDEMILARERNGFAGKKYGATYKL